MQTYIHDKFSQLFLPMNNIAEKYSDDKVIDLLLQGLGNLLFLFLLFLFVILVYKRIGRARRKKLWGFIDANLKWYVIIVWIFGFVCYFTGQYVGSGTFFNTVPMAIIHASGMFIGMSDVSEIREGPHNNALYMVCFNMSHILAVFGSFVFILRQFGYFIDSAIRIYIEAYIRHRKCDNLYIFWGLNESSFALARDIEATQGRGKYRIVFVRNYDDYDKDKEQYHIGQIFDKLKTNRQDLEKLRDLGCFSTASFHRLSHLDCKDHDSIIGEKMDMSALARLMQADRTEKTHIFLFGDNHQDNVAAATNLLKDKDVQAIDVAIYCHANNEKTTEWMQFYDITNPNEHTKVKMIDSAMLAVAELRKNTKLQQTLPEVNKSSEAETDETQSKSINEAITVELREKPIAVANQPVSFVDINPDATVDDKFEALVIGFGETGQETFNFLYEFSAFCGSDGKRSPFAIHVIDQNMDKLLGKLKMEHPALLKYIVNEGENMADRKYVLDFKNQNFTDEQFWDDLESYVDNLRYVVIAIDDNDREFDLASNIYQLAVRVSSANPFLKIYLKCNSKAETLQFDKALEFANRKMTKPGADDIIIPFGKLEDIFKYDNIIEDSLLQEAKTFYESYERKDKEKLESNNKDESKKDDNTDLWKNRREKCKKDYYALHNLRRKEFQDKANAMHVMTKMHLFAHAAKSNGFPFEEESKENLFSLAKMSFSGKMEKRTDISNIKYSAPDGYDETTLNIVLENLAKTEHCRWIASHELLGYVCDEAANEANPKKRTHPCMVDWDKIQEVSSRCWESYKSDFKHDDYKVVVTSFEIVANKLN